MVDNKLNTRLNWTAGQLDLGFVNLRKAIKWPLATAILLVGLAAPLSSADARVISRTDGTITIKAGNKTGLQQVFAWNARCRAVGIRFSGGASAGRLFRVGGSFPIRSGNCAGRRVSGFTVVYQAPRGFHGTARVHYTLKSANVRDTFGFSRLMIVK